MPEENERFFDHIRDKYNEDVLTQVKRKMLEDPSRQKFDILEEVLQAGDASMTREEFFKVDFNSTI